MEISGEGGRTSPVPPESEEPQAHRQVQNQGQQPGLLEPVFVGLTVP